MKVLRKIINYGKINLGSYGKDKNDKFYKELGNLINILFAVVFATGLTALNQFSWGYDFSTLLLAYFAILLSWWGYHFGTFVGGEENNIINLLIDCVLLAIYYLLIIQRGPFLDILGRYVLIFLLYFLWEFIRMLESKGKAVNVAAITNLIFFLIIGIIYLFFLMGSKCQCFDIEQRKFYIIIFLYIALFGYRVIIHKIYIKFSDLK